MKIKNLKLENYGRFEHLDIDFATKDEHGCNITVIVGNNGAGKSQILQALATGLSWFVNGLLHESGEKTVRSKEDNEFLKYPHEGEWIPQSLILNNKEYSELKLSFEDLNSENRALNINATKRDILKPAVYGAEGTGFNSLIKQYTYLFSVNKKSSLPIIANYTIDRNVQVKSIYAGYSFMNNQLSAYKDFLNAGSNYSEFFQWFRDNEDIENEIKKEKNDDLDEYFDLKKLESELYALKKQRNEIENLINYVDYEHEIELHQELAKIVSLIDRINSQLNQVLIRKNALNSAMIKDENNKLDYVRKAINKFTDLKNSRIRRQGTPTMIVEKDGEELDVNQLSQGEKSLLALVGDIARRLAILNPSFEDPLKGEGVVMIDEVDLHLHPKWQHDLIDKLVKTFPNVQFILTTHSPHVISDRNDILIYSLDDGELEEVDNVYGQDVNTVLTKVFDVDIRDSEVETKLNNIRRAISHKDYPTAEEGIEELANKMPDDDLELLKCRLMLAQAKVNDKDNDELVHADD